MNVYPFMRTPASDFASQKEKPVKNAPLRLLKFILTCENLGLKVIFGEQSIEYFLFKRICRRSEDSWRKGDEAVLITKGGKPCMHGEN